MSNITTLVFDFSRVLIFVKDHSYTGSMNDLYKQIKQNQNYNFFDYFYLNEELLTYLLSIKARFGLYIFTSSLFQEDPAILPKLKTIFNNVLFAERLGLNKAQPESFTRLANVVIKKSTDEIFFTDDQEQNIKAAQAAGFNARIYQNNQELISFLGTI